MALELTEKDWAETVERYEEQLGRLEQKLQKFRTALDKVGLLAERRRLYDRDECCVRMGDTISVTGCTRGCKLRAMRAFVQPLLVSGIF